MSKAIPAKDENMYSMNVDLGGDFQITVDTYNFKLERKGIKTSANGDKSPITTILGYYGTLADALIGFAKYSTRASGAKNIQELMAKLDSIENTIKTSIGDIRRKHLKL